MSDRKEKKYLARSKTMPEWYVVERSPHFGRVGSLADALIATKEWWEENLSPNWEDFFDLEEIQEIEDIQGEML